MIVRWFSVLEWWTLISVFCEASVWFVSLFVGWFPSMSSKTSGLSWWRKEISRPSLAWFIDCLVGARFGGGRELFLLLYLDNMFSRLLLISVVSVGFGVFSFVGFPTTFSRPFLRYQLVSLSPSLGLRGVPWYCNCILTWILRPWIS